MPEEPSVLDYLKSKLKFWEHGEKIHDPGRAWTAEGELLWRPPGRS